MLIFDYSLMNLRRPILSIASYLGNWSGWDNTNLIADFFRSDHASNRGEGLTTVAPYPAPENQSVLRRQRFAKIMMPAHQSARAYHIVVVDTGKDLRTIRRLLTRRGFKIWSHTSIGSALGRALASPPSMFILETDVDMGDGLELCKEIRRTAGLSLIPIVIVSHRSREWDVVAGLQAGADDYVTKPFRERELLARIDASLRRCYELSRPRLVQFDAIEINSDAITLTVHGRRHQLAPAEFRLLDYLVHNPGRAFSRDHLLGIIRSRPGSVKLRMIDVIVKRIRQAIEPDQQHPKYLRTVTGFGYCFYLPENAIGIEKRAKQ